MLLHFLMRTGYDPAVSVVHISVCNAFVDPIFICYCHGVLDSSVDKSEGL